VIWDPEDIWIPAFAGMTVRIMNITKATIDKVSRLSNLKIPDSHVEKFTKEFESTLEYVEILKEIDTEGVVPSYSASEKTNVWREDVVKPSLPRQEVLKNGKTYKNYFVAEAVKRKK
jgi:aspartyl-tRNA(Asn)/glutamyl-tRNA(Gln) amidotransferase subunit C